MVLIGGTPYEEVKCRILNAECQDEQLKYLVFKFKDDIKSQRRCDSIQNTADLITILERRDVLDDQSLCYIAEFLNCAIETQTNQQIPSTICTERMNNAAPYEPINSKHNKINNIIATEIGVKWKQFARALNIKESTIDQLGLRNENDVHESVIAVLTIHRSQFPLNSGLCELEILNALTSARRNDLRKKIETILNC